MSKTVILNIGNGCLEQGFSSVTVELLENSQLIEKISGSLPRCPKLANTYKETQNIYLSLYDRTSLMSGGEKDDADGFVISLSGITNVSVTNMGEQTTKLRDLLNDWFSEKSFNCLEKKLRARLNEDEEVLVLIETPDNQEILQRLPWDFWNFFESYKKAGCALRRQEWRHLPVQSNKKINNKIRILAIIGDTTNLDVDGQLDFLKELQKNHNAECETLVPKSLKEIFSKLENKEGWDILFFTGHSTTENNRGIMYFKDNHDKTISLSIEDFSNALNKAKKRLKLAIFNSCNGLGLALTLGRLNIPATIFMREPVANQVAEEFLRLFVEAFIKKHLSLHLAVREAKENLQKLEYDFPGASLLPLLYQHSNSDITWNPRSKGINHKKVTVTLIGLVSVITTVITNLDKLISAFSPFSVVFQPHIEKRLASELNNQEWSMANKTTDDILYKIIKLKKEEVISGDTKVNDEKIRKIPCDLLKEIDNLWIEHSNGKFGFSVQARIWEETQNDQGDPWDNFADRVGWRENGQWSIGHDDFTSYSKVNEGYLPNFILVGNGSIDWKTFFNHLRGCKIN